MTSTATTVLQILIAVAVLALVIRKRLTPRPVRGDTRRWRIPLVLVAIGGYSVISTTRGAHAVHFTGLDAGYLAIGILVSLVLGALRGATIKLTGSAAGLMQQYTYRTVALWALIILVRLGMDAVGKSAGVTGAVAGSSILLMFGVSLLGESMAVAARTGAVPGRAY